MASADIEVHYVLILSEDEAQALLDLLALVSGYPDTRRGHISDITEALEDLGLEYNPDADDLTGEIKFTYKEEAL